MWAATRGSKAQYVCSRTRPAAPVCKTNPTVSQVTPVFLAFSWFFFDPSYLGKQFAKASAGPVSARVAAASPSPVSRPGQPDLRDRVRRPHAARDPAAAARAVSISAKPRAADFVAPKVPAKTGRSGLGLFA